jgi:hypothetical protein
MDMNKWLYRAVGTVGVAGSVLLLSGGAAQAAGPDAPPSDPQFQQGLDHALNLGGAQSALDLPAIADSATKPVADTVLTYGGHGTEADSPISTPLNGASTLLTNVSKSPTAGVDTNALAPTSLASSATSTAAGVVEDPLSVVNGASTVPALIGDAMSAANPGLFTDPPADTEALPLVGGLLDTLPLLGKGTLGAEPGTAKTAAQPTDKPAPRQWSRSPSRPVAGEDPDYPSGKSKEITQMPEIGTPNSTDRYVMITLS